MKDLSELKKELESAYYDWRKSCLTISSHQGYQDSIKAFKNYRKAYANYSVAKDLDSALLNTSGIIEFS